MTYMINEWYRLDSDGTTCIFRTDDLEAWLKEIARLKKVKQIRSENCRWQESGTGDNRIVIFSYCNEKANSAWKHIQYTKKPNFIFTGFPEGVKYYE